MHPSQLEFNQMMQILMCNELMEQKLTHANYSDWKRKLNAYVQFFDLARDELLHGASPYVKAPNRYRSKIVCKRFLDENGEVTEQWVPWSTTDELALEQYNSHVESKWIRYQSEMMSIFNTLWASVSDSYKEYLRFNIELDEILQRESAPELKTYIEDFQIRIDRMNERIMESSIKKFKCLPGEEICQSNYRLRDIVHRYRRAHNDHDHHHTEIYWLEEKQLVWYLLAGIPLNSAALKSTTVRSAHEFCLDYPDRYNVQEVLGIVRAAMLMHGEEVFPPLPPPLVLQEPLRRAIARRRGFPLCFQCGKVGHCMASCYAPPQPPPRCSICKLAHLTKFHGQATRVLGARVVYKRRRVVKYAAL
jgi:hypothetical protein